MRRLVASGVVEEVDGRLNVSEALLRELARQGQQAPQAQEFGTGDERVEAVLRTFIRDGRLLKLPAQPGRREILLRHLAHRDFRPGENYSETAVNDVLRAWCEGGEADHVTIRRYLIDFRILDRKDGGDYWLYGGSPGV